MRAPKKQLEDGIERSCIAAQFRGVGVPVELVRQPAHLDVQVSERVGGGVQGRGQSAADLAKLLLAEATHERDCSAVSPVVDDRVREMRRGTLTEILEGNSGAKVGTAPEPGRRSKHTRELCRPSRAC